MYPPCLKSVIRSLTLSLGLFWAKAAGCLIFYLYTYNITLVLPTSLLHLLLLVLFLSGLSTPPPGKHCPFPITLPPSTPILRLPQARREIALWVVTYWVFQVSKQDYRYAFPRQDQYGCLSFQCRERQISALYWDVWSRLFLVELVLVSVELLTHVKQQ